MPIATYHQTKLALGSDTTLVIVSGLKPELVDSLFNKIWLKIFRFEQSFSRFLPNSELSLFNRNAGLVTPISQEFKEILLTAKNMAQKTEGLFNPFILPALLRAGYDKSFVTKYKSDNVDDYSMRAVTSPNNLIISESTAQIPANTAIDLGGIGKGYLADQIGKLKELKELEGYWFSFGGDIVGNGHDANNKPWNVSIQNAKAPKNTFLMPYVPQKNNFHVASSGTITRKFKTPHHLNQHHIIDPRTRKPAQTDILLATIEASSTYEADVYASCAVVLGSTQANQFLKSHSVNAFMLQLSSINQSIITKGNFDLIKDSISIGKTPEKG